MSNMVRIIRRPEVKALTQLGDTQINVHIALGEFPAPIKITESGRAIGWISTEIETWIASRAAARDKALQKKSGILDEEVAADIAQALGGARPTRQIGKMK